MAKYLYVKEDVAYAEYFIAPDISSLAYAAYYGAYLGELTGRTVQGISGDKNTFLEFKAKDGETYYVVSTLPYWESLDNLKDDKPVSGGTNTNTNTNSSGNSFGKILDVAKGLFGILSGGNNKTVATDNKTETGSSEEDNEDTPPVEEENKYLVFLKKNIVWFLPTVILVPILLFWLIRWAIRKMKKPPITPPIPNGV
ncbi:hypothetical protein [Cellulophaga sp. BC115SP]|uniref:hypothetical protein n=1 Tax=Cellulophaga sp. BC115SP TaxID=2683263 RepID=UPI001411DC90|nr:hypothetical protein [Cellulophaga sp. BC115SP]NBB30632.1 hypothetical protein [Cellulophaga sp. BC115SP]